MIKYLFLFITIILMPYFIHSAVLDCEWSGEVCTKVLSITPVNQPNEIITIAGKPLNYVNSATLLLTIGQPYSDLVFNLNYVPSGLFKVFPNLNAINMFNTSTYNLVMDAFKNCDNIGFLQMVNQNFTIIPAGFAQTCIGITAIYINQSQIEEIDIDAFKGLSNLRVLELSFNNIKCIPADLFKTVPTIEFISLNSNKITALDSNIFKNLPNLTGVQLANNLLTYLPDFDFNGSGLLQNMLTLNAVDNSLSALQPGFDSLFNSTNQVNFLVYLGNTSCATTQDYFMLDKMTYQNVLTNLQACFSNWSPSMSTSVTCFKPTTLAPSTTAAISTSAPTRKCPHGKNCRKKCRPL